MPANIRRIAVNTGGGDAPGLNAVIRAVTLSARWRGWEILGIRYGYRGLIENDPSLIVTLDRDAVRGITHLGGTILGSTNAGDPFHYPLRTGTGVVSTDVSDLVVNRAKALGIDAFVAIGGDGSIKLANRLVACGMPRVVAVPKTIDNDLPGTDVTFGFQTAVATATDALDKLHSTAAAHERVMVVEVMGRNAGWIALYAGIAGSADVILMPEIPFDMNVVAEKILRRQRRGRPFAIVVVAEGAVPRGGGIVYAEEEKSRFKEHQRLGGIGAQVADRISSLTGKETRSLVLGHLQRGGAPVTADRLLALRLGTAATRFLAETESQESGLVAVNGQRIDFVPLSKAATGIRTVPLDSEVLQTGRDLGICFGDEIPGTFLNATVLPPPPGPGEAG